MKTTVTFLALLTITPAFATTITPTEAKNHVGEVLTVEGVANVYSPASGVTFVDLGGRGRDAPFTGFIPKKDVPKFPGASGWTGKTLDITGTIQLYQGKAEIVVTDPGQVQVK